MFILKKVTMNSFKQFPYFLNLKKKLNKYNKISFFKKFICVVNLKKIKDHCKIYTFISTVVPLSFFASILAKEPQNLTVSLLIIPHQLVRDEILRVESVLWSLNYFATLPQNVV